MNAQQRADTYKCSTRGKHEGAHSGLPRPVQASSDGDTGGHLASSMHIGACAKCGHWQQTVRTKRTICMHQLGSHGRDKRFHIE